MVLWQSAMRTDKAVQIFGQVGWKSDTDDSQMDRSMELGVTMSIVMDNVALGWSSMALWEALNFCMVSASGCHNM